MQPHNFIEPKAMWINLTKVDFWVKRNSQAVRATLRKLLTDRRLGKSEAFYGDDTPDLLSILLQNEFYMNDDEKIIDEIFTLFLAGSKTVQTTTTNLVCYLDKNPKEKKILVEEIDSKLSPIKDRLIEKFDQDLAEEFSYLRNCFYESLRIEPPVNTALDSCFTQDVTLGGVLISKGDCISVCLDSVHHDAT